MISQPADTSERSAHLQADDLETSLAPREGELLSLPFDQYGRMRVAQELAALLREAIAGQTGFDPAPTKIRALDVGGYPGILQHFLPGDHYELTVLDVVPDDGTIANYVQGSGMGLPFGDGSFDVVFSLDTLEHIPQQHRGSFLSELRRVAKYAAVLINPVQSLPADLAEETLDEYIRWILEAQQEQLAEHRAFGLPDFDATRFAFDQDGWTTTAFRLANVYNWLFMMVAKHYLISMRDERASAFERALDRFYNLTFFESDRSEPTYRGAIVAVKPQLEAVLARVSDKYPAIHNDDASNAVRLQLSEVLMSLLNLKSANHENKGLREQMERRDKHIAGLDTRIALLTTNLAGLEEHIATIQATYTTEFAQQKTYITRLEEDVKSKDEHILYLEKLLQGIESGRVFRLTRTLSRFLGRH